MPLELKFWLVLGISKDPFFFSFFVGGEECEALHNRKKEMTYNTSKKEKEKEKREAWKLSSLLLIRKKRNDLQYNQNVIIYFHVLF